MKNRILPIVLVIAAIFAAYYLGTQNPSSPQDLTNVHSAAATVQPLSHSTVTSAPKATATPKRTATPAPKKQTYVLNRSTKKFHYPSCSSVKQMKESNKIYSTDSREQIIKQGYSPCGRCHP